MHQGGRLEAGPSWISGWLWFLLVLFAMRVAGQLLAGSTGATWLPAFDAWQSGVVAYPLLLTSQLAILAAMIAGARQVQSSRARFGARTGAVLVGFGVLYFASMALRLALGMTILRTHPWFGRPVPAFFHLVLASYVLLYGWYQVRHDSRA